MTWDESKRSAAPQLDLFASSTSRSKSHAPISPCLSEPATSSDVKPSRRRIVVTSMCGSSSATELIATERSALAGVASAAESSRDARSTAEPAQRPTTSLDTTRPSMDSMLAIPRPKTRAECRAEARPCPWVGCRHHLLIEVATASDVETRDDPRATTIRINRPPEGRAILGRRPGISPSTARDLVRIWIDDAVELLQRMRYTCALDVVDEYPDGIPPSSVAWIFGLTEPTIDQELRKPHVIEACESLREYAEP